jgi:CRP-like cAMP-binding protein
MHSDYLADLQMLMDIPVFAGVPIEPMKVLTYLCNRESFKPGEFLFRQDETDTHAYLLVEGEVSVVQEENPETVLGKFGPGDFIGALSLFWDSRRLFSLRAATGVVCLMLSREMFQKTMEQFPAVGPLVFQRIAEQIYQWEYRFLRDYAQKCPSCRHGLGVSLI